MNKEKYLVICLRNNNWKNHDNIIFWGKNRNGYTDNILDAGLYSLEDAKRISEGSHNQDISIPLSFLNINEEFFKIFENNKKIKLVCDKSKEICDYINKFSK